MGYIIYNSKDDAAGREQELTDAGIAAGYFAADQRYDIGGWLVNHPTEDKAAILVYRFSGMYTRLSDTIFNPQNFEPLFSADELAAEVDELPEDWFIIDK